MSESLRHLSVLVIGDDPVASGMLALDLVQAGISATAAGDDYAVLGAARAAREGGVLTELAVVATFDDVGRATALWKSLVDEGMVPRFIVGVRPRDLSLAEHEAIRSGWSGVAERPIAIDALLELLRQPATMPRLGGRDGGEFGDLSQKTLGDLLEALVLEAARGGRTDAVVRLESDGRTGEVAMIDGQLVHAVADQDQGRHALERMFCWRRGRWHLSYGRHTGPRTLAGVWRGTLAAAHEYARRVDEARVTMPLRDAVCQVRWEKARPLPAVAEAVFRRIAAGMPIGVAIDGEGDDELEALASLHSRIARGAVVARDGEGLGSAGQTGAYGVRRPAGASGAHAGGKVDVYTSGFAARAEVGRPALDPRPGQRHAQTMAGAAFRADGRAGAPALAEGDGATVAGTPSGGASGGGRRSPTVAGASGTLLPSAPVGWVDSPVSTRASHRHAATETYQSGTHALPGSRDPQAQGEAGGREPEQLLPDVLPDPAGLDLDPEPTDGQGGRLASGAWRSANWFGVNVRPDANEGQARLEALGRSLVAPVPRDQPRDQDNGAAPQLSATPAELHRMRGDEGQASTLDAWSGDAEGADLDASQGEPEVATTKSKRMWWSAAMVLCGAGLALLVLWPESPLYRAMGREVDAPIIQTHRRAVRLADAGRPVEALTLLQMISDRPGAPAEALLEQAILELELGEVDEGKRDLHRYTLMAGARHAEAATRLHAAIGGELPAP